MKDPGYLEAALLKLNKEPADRDDLVRMVLRMLYINLDTGQPYGLATGATYDDAHAMEMIAATADELQISPRYVAKHKMARWTVLDEAACEELLDTEDYDAANAEAYNRQCILMKDGRVARDYSCGHHPMDHWEPDDYDERVTAYEREGMTRSDAQGVVDAEISRLQPKKETS